MRQYPKNKRADSPKAGGEPVIVETLGEAPYLSLAYIDHPFLLVDKIFQIKDIMEKKEERKR